MPHDIVLTVDYHDQTCALRRLDEATGKDRTTTVPTTAAALLAEVAAARQAVAAGGGQVVWLQESTTGWARMQQLLAGRVDFRLVNVLQLPQAPAGRRRKTDQLDTARLQREYRNGSLRYAHQPDAPGRQLRRLVAYREDLTNRRTALSNWLNRYLAHETWEARGRLSSAAGRARLRAVAETLAPGDRLIVLAKLAAIEQVNTELQTAARELLAACKASPAAQRLDAIRGVGVLAAISLVARLGPVARFRNAEHLIAYAGLAPGVRQSDQTRRDGRRGGGGTDRRLRHYLIEATVWARTIPRYRDTYERVARRRGPKIGRLTVARLLLRSVYKVLRDGVAFQAERPAPPRP